MREVGVSPEPIVPEEPASVADGGTALLGMLFESCPEAGIHGYAQPDAPPAIGEALAQARATSVRRALLHKLKDVPDFSAEDPDEGVRPDRELSPWSAGRTVRSTRLVGDKVQALGRWGHQPQNSNFEARGEDESAAVGGEEEELAMAGGDDANIGQDDEDESDDPSDEDEEYGGRERMRRAEFTLLGLDL